MAIIRYAYIEFKYFAFSEKDAECDRSCNIASISRFKRDAAPRQSNLIGYDNYKSNLIGSPEYRAHMSSSDNYINPHTRWKRATTRPKYQTDRGPIEIVDRDGNPIELEQQLQKPRKFIFYGFFATS